MSGERLVIDASVAMKWVVPEPDTAEAIVVQRRFTLVAPDLLMAECANMLWNKVARGEISGEEASIAARVIEQADIEKPFRCAPCSMRASGLPSGLHTRPMTAPISRSRCCVGAGS